MRSNYVNCNLIISNLYFPREHDNVDCRTIPSSLYLVAEVVPEVALDVDTSGVAKTSILHIPLIASSMEVPLSNPTDVRNQIVYEEPPR